MKEENFYCTEFNSVGYQCEEQCDKCNRTGLLESPPPPTTASLDELVEGEIDNYSLQESCSPSDAEFIAKYMEHIWQFVKLKAIPVLLKEKEHEIEELQAWKESAMAVMPDFQAIGKAIGVKLGHSVHDKILPAILKLQSQLGNGREEAIGFGKWFYEKGHQLRTLKNWDELYLLYLQSLSTKPSTDNQGKIGNV